MALLHLILWLIHAVVAALASALVDVFTHVLGWLTVLILIAAIAAGVATAFGIGGVGLARQRRKRNRS